MKLLVLLLLPCLSLSKVAKDFGNCKDFFMKNKPPEFTPQWGNSVQKICQCLGDNNQKIDLYATLYNTDWRIPIYSAYVFKRSESVGRCDPWYIEPQLDGDAKSVACMRPEANIQNIGNNQAVNSDYDQSGYDKGQLYPVLHTDDPLSMLATSTLTNAAPQDSSFNQGEWSKHEEAVVEDLKSCDKAYVVTGVVPDHTKPKLNNRVTVSKYYWRATCCLKKKDVYIGRGYFGPDNNNVVKQLTIITLQQQLTKDYGVNNVVIFPKVQGGCN